MIARFLIVLIGAYRTFLSPMLGNRCRFHPSCSAYAIEALQVMPLHRALRLIVCRVARCSPLHPGGIDPVQP